MTFKGKNKYEFFAEFRGDKVKNIPLITKKWHQSLALMYVIRI